MSMFADAFSEALMRFMMDNNVVGVAGTFRLPDGSWLTTSISAPFCDDGKCDELQAVILRELQTNTDLQTIETVTGYRKFPERRSDEMPH